jgi:hypothetical protein
LSFDFIFSIAQATAAAIVMPIVALCLFYIIIPKLRNGSGSKMRRYLSYLIIPPRIGVGETGTPADVKETKSAKAWRDDKVRLYFFYLGVVLFLVSFTIGEFYEVMFDLLLPVSQGSKGEMRIVTSVIFQSPFSMGWVGSLPWMGLITYHETWSWIFFTAAFTDNPIFLSSTIIVLTLISIGGGLVYLILLAIKRIRYSFLPSMFFFMTGMTIFTKAVVSWFAYGIALLYGNMELEYMALVATGNMIPGLSNVIAFGFPLALAMFALFILLGRKLWQVHYTDSKSMTWFLVYIALSFWLGFAITIMVV